MKELPLLDTPRPNLDRVLDPATVAFVGISETSAFARGPAATAASGAAEVFFVHPKHDTVFGRPCFPSLTEIGQPIDAVFVGVSAERTVHIIEEAGRCGAGGIVTAAGGFAEAGANGAQLQDRMIAAAQSGNLPVVGPNGVGLINVRKDLDLSILPSFPRRIGGVSVIASSGALLGALAAASWRAGGVGYNLLISAGNEPVTDMADYLEYLIEDPNTRIIGLAIEKIRRPAAFFAAARRAREAGKPIFAIKLGRGERAQRMARSHTGTLTGDGWVYEVALKQANVQLVPDVDELVDRLQILEQLPSERWRDVRGLSVLTMTGGFAAMASDLADEEAMEVPDVPRLNAWIGSVVPGATVANPLDATGFHVTHPEIWETVVGEYAAAPEFDSYVWLNQFAEWDDTPRGRGVIDVYVAAAQTSDRPFVISTLAGPPGWWMDEYRAKGLAVTNGLRGTLRGFAAMAAFMRSRPTSFVHDPLSVPAVEVPATASLVVDAERMLPFAATMELLAEAGVSVADYALVAPHEVATSDSLEALFPGPYVVKLADVAHRTEHGAVEVAVPADGVAAAVERMRLLARTCGLPATVAIQPMIQSEGEVFVGIRGNTELGPVVAFGVGGVFVEVLGRVSGRLAPFALIDAYELLAEFDDIGVMNGLRGARPWDRDQLAALLVGIGRLAAAGREWIQSFDINPIIFGPTGFVAVDGLVLLR